MKSLRFRTELETAKAHWPITHQSGLLMLGSCFSDEIGRKLSDAGFDVLINPTGTLYNPFSIANAIESFMSDDCGYDESHCVYHNGLWHSFDHHTRFSAPDIDELEIRIVNAHRAGHVRLKSTTHLFLTLGSAFVFELNASGQIVANCHKLPASAFTRRRLRVEEIVNRLAPLLSELHNCYPCMKVVFTVSPIRHVADGLHGNQVSKATLHLAVDELCNQFVDFVSYFPAYEALIDDLRDYRFYADDLVHPSTMAVRYVYSLLADTYFDDNTRMRASECEKETKRNNHRAIAESQK